MPILYKGAPKMASQPVKCLQMSLNVSKCLQNVSKCLQNVSKTSPKCLQNVSKMSPKCLQMSQSRHFPPTGYTNLKFLTPSLHDYFQPPYCKLHCHSAVNPEKRNRKFPFLLKCRLFENKTAKRMYKL